MKSREQNSGFKKFRVFYGTQSLYTHSQNTPDSAPIQSQFNPVGILTH
jgi:hypothetical protein